MKLRRVAVRLDRPSLNDFAARLLNRIEACEFALDLKPRFLDEFTLGRLERILVFGDFPFRNCPGASILLRPKRPAGMDQKNFELAAVAIQQQTGAAFLRHNYLSCPKVRRMIAISSENLPPPLFFKHKMKLPL